MPTIGDVEVRFERTGRRRYATVVVPEGSDPLRADPAPGYDDEIPHDLVHYLVEAELGLTSGVYGRAAAGGGEFRATVETVGDKRRRSREQRRLKRKEASLRHADAGTGDMARSEQVAALCDLTWRRRQGATTPTWSRRTPVAAEDQAVVDRVLEHLARLAPLWRTTPAGGSLAFTWPDTSVRTNAVEGS